MPYPTRALRWPKTRCLICCINLWRIWRWSLPPILRWGGEEGSIKATSTEIVKSPMIGWCNTTMTHMAILHSTFIEDTVSGWVSFFKPCRGWVSIPPTSLLKLMRSTTMVSPPPKCTATIHMLAYSSVADSIDEYIKIGKNSTLKFIK